MKIAVLTSKNQWFEPYAFKLAEELNCEVFFKHNNAKNLDIVFILSYHKIIPKEVLEKNRHNIVVHASPLPKGKGWSPLFWQILEGKNNITFTMFEASDGVDEGNIYMQKTLELNGYELHDEIRQKQANFTLEMCKEFIKNYDRHKRPMPQIGDESFYPKRTPKDSKLDINKTIKEQFNLLRICSNEKCPAFFEIDGNRYILKIELAKIGGIEMIDFVDLTPDERVNILKYRNNENVKKWMYNTEDITLDEHISFINSLIGNENKNYLLVRSDGIDLGVVDFMIENNEAFFGLYANPFKKVAGVGRILEEICIKYIFDILKLDKLKLEVFSDNEKAINLYKKFNFKEVKRKELNNKEVICMELKNENR